MMNLKTLFKTKPMAVPVVFATILVLLKVGYLFITPLDLAPDEAHYWEWSRHLDLSYYSKPPMVAWLIHLSTQIFGHTLLGVRFFAILAQGGLLLLAFDLARRAAGQRAAWFAFVTIALVPMIAAGGLLMTPDVPSLFFFVLGLWLLSKIEWHKPEGQLGLFAAVGLAVGFAGLSKYTAAVFYPLLFAFLAVNATRRHWLKRPEPYLAGFISLFCTMPVFIWNAQHNWISFRHVAGQAEGGGAFEPLKTLGNFLGGEVGVVGPVLFVLLLVYWLWAAKAEWQKHKNGVQNASQTVQSLLWWFSAPLFAFFVLKSLGGKVQPNWPVLAVFVGLVGLAAWVALRSKVWHVVFYVGLALSGLMTVVAHDTFILRAIGIDFPAKKDPLKPVQGWRGLGDLIRAHLMQLDDNTIILTTRYQTASELAFYARLPDRMPEVIYVNPGNRRQNQYDLWPWPEDMENRLVLYVNEGGELEDVVKNGFKHCGLLGRVASHRWQIIQKQATLYLCYGYTGIERPKPEVY